MADIEVGQRVGRWTVLNLFRVQDKHQSRPAASCRCDCGTVRTVLIQTLKSPSSSNPSCGCWKRERSKTIVSETRWKDSHGYAAKGKDPLYWLWQRVNKRCYNSNAHNYRWYGARGIGVWEPWRHDARAFIEYILEELGPRPPKHSLDRIDNDGDYEPGNLRWATQLTQVRNSRSYHGYATTVVNQVWE